MSGLSSRFSHSLVPDRFSSAFQWSYAASLFRLPLFFVYLYVSTSQRFFSRFSSRSTTSLPIEHRRYDYCLPPVFLISLPPIAFHMDDAYALSYCIDQLLQNRSSFFQERLRGVEANLDKVPKHFIELYPSL